MKEKIMKTIETIMGILFIFIGIALICGIIEMIFDVLHTISHYISDIGLYAAIFVAVWFVLKKLFGIDYFKKIKNKLFS